MFGGRSPLCRRVVRPLPIQEERAMPRRFSDEPINLIRRIPTPEQLSAARPTKRAFGQVIVESGAACVRTCAEIFSRIARPMGRMTQTEVRAENEPVTRVADHPAEEAKASETAPPELPAGSFQAESREATLDPNERPMPAAVLPEEVAELRAFLLTQQQDIARLSAQVQELKSLVASQQQVLVYLGKEWEGSPVSRMAAGVASGPAKRNRPAREKPSAKDKTSGRKDASTSSSLSF